MEFWALYLPAFHRIKENDEWWGEGFTEWDNVKKGRPFFSGHKQPMVPLNGYYDLANVETLAMQAEIANKYGVDGFIFYHYWFKNGKKLLEKPAEMLLKNKDINIKFSFCWANEPWARTWDGKNKDVLMSQDYGGIEDWIEHIKYLADFFRDPRYHKINGKPVIYIYSASRIPEFDSMIRTWNNYLISVGLKELYIIEFISSFNLDLHSSLTDSVLEFEPLYTTRFDISLFRKIKRLLCKKIGLIDYQDYDHLWSMIINRRRSYNGRGIVRSCFVGWDNSPRKGKNSMVVLGSSPEKFHHYLLKLATSKRNNLSNHLLVINAWNEWGEGAVLEPTLLYRYGYLEAIKEVKTQLNIKIE